ncbi:MAG TPA: RNA methyltransferase, partial [Candidatus Competibacter sp.]|nr:RNA methyltransferase [Candidatus Competibacter sp.]
MIIQSEKSMNERMMIFWTVLNRLNRREKQDEIATRSIHNPGGRKPGAGTAEKLRAALIKELPEALAAQAKTGDTGDVADPGNVGTLMRVAESSGCAGVVLAGSGVDLYNPKVVRSSAGSMLRLPIAADPDPQAVLVALAELGVLTAAAVARDGVAHLDASLGGAVALRLAADF